MENTIKKLNFDFCGAGKHKISLEGLLKLKNAILLDVRTEEEVECLRFDLAPFGIPTLHIPLHELPDRITEIPKDKLIACFCSSGTRSAWAYLYLLDRGFNTVWLAAKNEDLAALLKPGKIFKAIKKENQ